MHPDTLRSIVIHSRVQMVSEMVDVIVLGVLLFVSLLILILVVALLLFYWLKSRRNSKMVWNQLKERNGAEHANPEEDACSLDRTQLTNSSEGITECTQSSTVMVQATTDHGLVGVIKSKKDFVSSAAAIEVEGELEADEELEAEGELEAEDEKETEVVNWRVNRGNEATGGIGNSTRFGSYVFPTTIDTDDADVLKMTELSGDRTLDDASELREI